MPLRIRQGSRAVRSMGCCARELRSGGPSQGKCRPAQRQRGSYWPECGSSTGSPADFFRQRSRSNRRYRAPKPAGHRACPKRAIAQRLAGATQIDRNGVAHGQPIDPLLMLRLTSDPAAHLTCGRNVMRISSAEMMRCEAVSRRIGTKLRIAIFNPISATIRRPIGGTAVRAARPGTVRTLGAIIRSKRRQRESVAIRTRGGSVHTSVNRVSDQDAAEAHRPLSRGYVSILAGTTTRLGSDLGHERALIRYRWATSDIAARSGPTTRLFMPTASLHLRPATLRHGKRSSISDC